VEADNSWLAQPASVILAIMNTPSASDVVVTLVSLWSAMLGGALGAAMSQAGGSLACHAATGFIGGLVFSVLLYLPLMGVTQAVALFILRREIEGRPIGCTASDKLSGLLGGTAGAVGAIVVAALPKNTKLSDPPASILCWTVTAFVAILLGLAVVYSTRWKSKVDWRRAWSQVIRTVRK
jgi:hypothetical protein